MNNINANNYMHNVHFIGTKVIEYLVRVDAKSLPKVEASCKFFRASIRDYVELNKELLIRDLITTGSEEKNNNNTTQLLCLYYIFKLTPIDGLLGYREKFAKIKLDDTLILKAIKKHIMFLIAAANKEEKSSEELSFSDFKELALKASDFNDECYLKEKKLAYLQKKLAAGKHTGDKKEAGNALLELVTLKKEGLKKEQVEKMLDCIVLLFDEKCDCQTFEPHLTYITQLKGLVTSYETLFDKEDIVDFLFEKIVSEEHFSTCILAMVGAIFKLGAYDYDQLNELNTKLAALAEELETKEKEDSGKLINSYTARKEKVLTAMDAVMDRIDELLEAEDEEYDSDITD